MNQTSSIDGDSSALVMVLDEAFDECGSNDEMHDWNAADFGQCV